MKNHQSFDEYQEDLGFYCLEFQRQQQLQLRIVDLKTDTLKNHELQEKVFRSFQKLFNIYVPWITSRNTHSSNSFNKYREDDYDIQEKNDIIGIYKNDLKTITLLLEQYEEIIQQLKNIPNELCEQGNLQIICQEGGLNYDTLRQFLNEGKALSDFFFNNKKNRGYVYTFLKRYAKLKLYSNGVQQFILREGRVILVDIIMIMSNLSSIRLPSNQNHFQLTQQCLRQNQVFIDNFLRVARILKESFDDCIEPLITQNKSYSLIVLAMQKVTKQKDFHDYLIDQLTIQMTEMIQVNLTRDFKTTKYFDCIVDNVQKSLNNMKEQIDSTMREIIDSNSEESSQMESKWIEMKHQQILLVPQQEPLRIELERRKQEFFSDKQRYSLNPNNDCQYAEINLSIKECFRLYYHDELNDFFLKFKQISLKQFDVSFSGYDRKPPIFYDQDECLDLSSLIECFDIRQTILYKHPINEKLFYFVPEYATCRQEDHIYFLNENEFMVETEVFLSNFMYSDYFTLQQYIYYEEISNQKTKITYGFCKHIVKSTFLEKIVESKTKANNKFIIETLVIPEMKLVGQQYIDNRFQHQQKRKKKFIHQMMREDSGHLNIQKDNVQILQQERRIIPPNNANLSNVQLSTYKLPYDQILKLLTIIMIMMALAGRFGRSQQ